MNTGLSRRPKVNMVPKNATLILTLLSGVAMAAIAMNTMDNTIITKVDTNRYIKNQSDDNLPDIVIVLRRKAQSAALHTSKQETGEHLLMREILGSLLPAGSPQPSSPALHQPSLREPSVYQRPQKQFTDSNMSPGQRISISQHIQS